MRKVVRNGLLAVGCVIFVLGIIIIFLYSFMTALLFLIIGIILIFIALYNWDAGLDFAHRQDTPIENINYGN